MEMVWPGVGGVGGEEPSLTSAYWRPEGVVVKVRLGVAEEVGVAALVGGGGESERRRRGDWRRRERRDGEDVCGGMMGGFGDRDVDVADALRGCWISTCQHRHIGAMRSNEIRR